VYGVALTHTATRADADDVFQEVFVAYWKGNPRLTSEEHRKAWLIRTTLNCSLKVTQSSWAKKTVYADGAREQGSNDGLALIDSSAGIEETPEDTPFVDFPFQTEQQTALYAAIRSLPIAYRTVVMLFYFEDLSIAQIAATLEDEQGAVKTRLSRARAQLRTKLKEGVRDE